MSDLTKEQHAMRLIETHCSRYGDATRWCDFCHRRAFPYDSANHSEDCPVRILHELVESAAPSKPSPQS